MDTDREEFCTSPIVENKRLLKTLIPIQNVCCTSSKNNPDYIEESLPPYITPDEKENQVSLSRLEKSQTPSEFMNNHKCLSGNQHKINQNDLTSTIHLDPLTTKDPLHSPWPFLEVDQLAYMIICMKKKVSKTSISASKRVYTSSSSSSSELTTSDEELPEITMTNIRNYSAQNPGYKRRLNTREENITSHKVKTIHKRLIIVDCRYPYEYNAGHIRGAINLSDWPNLCQYFFGTNRPEQDFKTSLPNSLSLPLEKYFIKPKPSRTLVVLHCEFSSKRAPELFHLLRNHDRTINFSSYPALRYPKVCILRGGYAAFFKDYPELCEPSGYLQMSERPELSSIWRKHCNRVNRNSMDNIKQLDKENKRLNPNDKSSSIRNVRILF